MAGNVKGKMLFIVLALAGFCMPAVAQQHSADVDGDFAISLSELLRVIQFFNSDEFHCQAGTEDGYAPGPGDQTCDTHNSDYTPQDWHINLSELLRIIQFFNSGGYHTQCDSEDTFAPGAGSHESCEGEGEGSSEGQEEGAVEGQIEGEGIEEGSTEGQMEEEGGTEGEGDIEGAFEGNMEGALEGIFEGQEEGMPEGDAEGGMEGQLEGEGMAEGEGHEEGQEEGHLEGSIEGGIEGAIEGEGSAEGEGGVEGALEGGVEGQWEGEGSGEGEGSVEGVEEGSEEGAIEGMVEGEGGVEGQPEGEICIEGECETILLPGDVPLEMVWVPGGSFMMGRYSGEQDSYNYEDVQHMVTVPGFWMGKYELTKAQWTAVMGTSPWTGQIYVLDDLNSPAVYVSWIDAQSFLTALNVYTGLTFRLPSEAEWEYASRAGTTTRFYWGDDPGYTAGNDYYWWYSNAYGIGEHYAHIVGLKRSNLFGLYDMSGNVWEWCEDDWHNNYTGAPTEGTAWVDLPRGSSRVLRSGGWNDYGNYCRSAFRYYCGPSFAFDFIGFRLSR